jgi:prepilin-type N-terminal cleavage/methylation domain-containing protein
VKAILLKYQGQRGLTLLEIIITLIVASALGAMLVQFMGTNMIRSTKPVVMAQEGLYLNQILEAMTADYRRLLATDGTPLQTFKTYAENGNIVGNTPYYGQYAIQTLYIAFPAGDEVADISGDNNTLKLTISHGDQSLTALFTK